MVNIDLQTPEHNLQTPTHREHRKTAPHVNIHFFKGGISVHVTISTYTSEQEWHSLQTPIYTCL